MGIAASLFYFTGDKNTLDFRVRPSDEQYDQQQERWNDLADYLLEDLKIRSGHTISSWLQGSYKFGTQIRPSSAKQEFDIDLGVYFRWNGTPEDGDHEPAELKSFVRESLLEYAADEKNEAHKVADTKPRCERLHFRPDFHIDVPCYHLSPLADVRHLAIEENDWEKSDPKAIYRWWKDSFSDGDLTRLRRLVRYLKMWAALKFKEAKRPSSILLTVLVGNAWEEIEGEDLSGDDEYLVEVVRKIEARLSRSTVVPNPANGTENLNRLAKEQTDALLDELGNLVSTGERGLNAPTRTATAEIWADAFDHFFPMPEEDEEHEVVLAKAGGALVPVLFDPQVAAEARPRGRPEHVFRGINEIGPIPKDCSIMFTLINAEQLPRGATISWTVRNQGQEAEDENDLGHRSGHKVQVEEHSAYRGTQYMDIAVRLDTTLIGRRRIPVKITGMPLPLRNPPKPNWVKLRGRR